MSSGWRTASPPTRWPRRSSARRGFRRRSSFHRPTTGWPPTWRVHRGRPRRRGGAGRRLRLGIALRFSPGAARLADATRRRRGPDSTHKIVGSLTQSAMLHVAADGPIDADEVARACGWCARRARTRCCWGRSTPRVGSWPRTARRCWTGRSRPRPRPARLEEIPGISL